MKRPEDFNLVSNGMVAIVANLFELEMIQSFSIDRENILDAQIFPNATENCDSRFNFDRDLA